MIKIKTVSIIAITIFLIACYKQEADNSVNNEAEENAVELNLDIENDQSQPEPIIPQEQAAPFENFYLSGRTELLSLQSPGVIGAEDFEIGSLFEIHRATITEKKLVRLSMDLFYSIVTDEPDYSNIDPIWKQEIIDYVNYFIRNKIDIDRVVYGKPEIKGPDSNLQVRLYPDKILAHIYFNKNDDNEWMITGLELDLRREENAALGKWFPSISPSPLGY